MNIYKKILNARQMFISSNVKKSGRNNFQNFNYFELEDIVPTALKICGELNILPLTSFNCNTASLKIVDIDKPEDTVEFLSPIPTITEGNSNKAIQDVGKIQTYQRRYLYMQFLDIVESDGIDGASKGTKKVVNKPKTAPKPPKKDKPPAPPSPVITEKKGNNPGPERIQMTVPENEDLILKVDGISKPLTRMLTTLSTKETLTKDSVVKSAQSLLGQSMTPDQMTEVKKALGILN